MSFIDTVCSRMVEHVPTLFFDSGSTIFSEILKNHYKTQWDNLETHPHRYFERVRMASALYTQIAFRPENPPDLTDFIKVIVKLFHFTASALGSESLPVIQSLKPHAISPEVKLLEELLKTPLYQPEDYFQNHESSKYWGICLPNLVFQTQIPFNVAGVVSPEIVSITGVIFDASTLKFWWVIRRNRQKTPARFKLFSLDEAKSLDMESQFKEMCNLAKSVIVRYTNDSTNPNLPEVIHPSRPATKPSKSSTSGKIRSLFRIESLNRYIPEEQEREENSKANKPSRTHNMHARHSVKGYLRNMPRNSKTNIGKDKDGTPLEGKTYIRPHERGAQPDCEDHVTQPVIVKTSNTVLRS